MQFLKYYILSLIFFNLPSFFMFNVSYGFGSFASFSLTIGIFVYFFLESKIKASFWLVALGLLYFGIGALQAKHEFIEFFKEFFKYFVLVICCGTLCKKTTTKQILCFLSIGVLTILIHALFFPSLLGRYSGFFMNPNQAGFVCLLGYALTFTIKNLKLKYSLLSIFALCGFLTLSRYCIIMLVFITLLSIIENFKHILLLFGALIGFIVVLNTSAFDLNTERLGAFQSLYSDNVDTKTISKGSRHETWAQYTDIVLDNLVYGAGYGALHGDGTRQNAVGVHNTYLLVLGEAGILTLIALIALYYNITIKSISVFKRHPEYVYLSVILLSYLLETHNYFDNHILIFITTWIVIQLRDNYTLSQADNLNLKHELTTT